MRPLPAGSNRTGHAVQYDAATYVVSVNTGLMRFMLLRTVACLAGCQQT